MIDVSVDVTRTRNLGPRTREAVMQYIEAGADRGFATYIEEMPVDRGNMQQNSYSPTRDGDTVRYGTRDIPYAEAQDEGTGPFTPPLEPLLRWGDRVLGSSVSADEILRELEEDGWHPGIFRHPGAAVWSKIRSEGIEAKNFSDKAIEEQQSWYRRNDASAWIQREFR